MPYRTQSSLIVQWPLSTSFTKRCRSSTGLVSNQGIPHPPEQAREVLAMCPDTCKLCTRVVPLALPNNEMQLTRSAPVTVAAALAADLGVRRTGLMRPGLQPLATVQLL